MTVQDIYVNITILGKDILDLKGKTTRKKTLPVTEELIQVPIELIKIHRDIVTNSDIFVVNTIQFSLTLSRFFKPWYTIM